MPLPRAIARANRNGFNRLSRRFAGSLPPFAMVHHVGRSSGKAYDTPIMAFRRGHGFVICLTYGPTTDWVRNFFAAGSCELTCGNIRYRIFDGRLIHGSPSDQPLPSPIKAALTVMRVRDFLHVQATELDAEEAPNA